MQQHLRIQLSNRLELDEKVLLIRRDADAPGNLGEVGTALTSIAAALQRCGLALIQQQVFYALLSDAMHATL